MKICFFILMVFSGALLATAQGSELQGTVVSVKDGDTLVLLTLTKRQVRVRLADIDTPEHDQPYGSRAKQALSALAFGKTAQLRVRDRDDYGRLVARVYVEGKDINAELVRQGLAWVYRPFNRDPSLLQLEADARMARRGLWSLPEAQRIPPWEWRHGEPPAQQGQSANSSPTLSAFRCGAKKRCQEMISCEEARFYLVICGVKTLDGDKDGTPCETLCNQR